MKRKVNCKYNDSGLYCKNKKVRRSLKGLGARCCTIAYHLTTKCEYQEKILSRKKA